MLAIVVPVFNTESYLLEMINSLQSQTIKDFSVYLVNDGSTDSSLDICKQVAEEDQRFKILSKINGGPGSARNFALECIEDSGIPYKYIYFCDSDDRLDERALERVITEMERTDADYGLFSVKSFDKASVKMCRMRIKDVRKLSHKEIVKQYFRFGIRWKKEPSSEAFLNNKVFRLSRILGYRFREDVKRAEDFDFFLKILPRLRTGVLVPDAYYYYRLRKTSLTNSYSDTGDLIVCSSHYSKMDDRDKVERLSIQHRLIRAYYLDACKAYNDGDMHLYKEIIENFSKIPIKYRLLIADYKIMFFLRMARPLFPLYIKFRKTTKRERDRSQYFQ